MSSEDLRRAVREFRLSIRDQEGNSLSQTEFGRLLGKSLNTVQRYETLVAPRGKVLAQLSQLATEHRQKELASLFLDALEKELGPGFAPFSATSWTFEAKSEMEWIFVSIALKMAQDEGKYGHLWKPFLDLTKKAWDEVQKEGLDLLQSAAPAIQKLNLLVAEERAQQGSPLNPTNDDVTKANQYERNNNKAPKKKR